MDTFPDWWADLQDLPAELGFFGVFLVLCACGFGLPMSKDALLFATGTAAGLMGGGRAALEAFLWCLAGVVTGDAVMYLEGRLCGPWLRKSRLIRRILPPRRFARIRHAFRRRGVAVLLTARFTPGIRGPVYICCGLIRALGFPSFMLINTLSSTVYTALWITAGCLLADQLENATASTAFLQRWILAAVAVIMLSFLLAVQIIRRRRKAVDARLPDPGTPAAMSRKTGTEATATGRDAGEP